jgi:hydroxyacylglutathione hydrolase
VIFESYYLECLSQASYLVADQESKQAAIVDPQRDIDLYLRDLEEKGLTLTYIFETHVHADFLSGHLELANKTGATIVYGSHAEGRLGFDATFAHDGDLFALNDNGVHFGVIETPGHTPESITVAVFSEPPTDFSAGKYSEPELIFTGDTLFIGDVGRPDLLGAVGLAPEDMASQLYDSLHNKILTLPDATLVYPAHGAGSACGKSLSSERSSSLGVQRTSNYALQIPTKEEFIDIITEGQPLTPQYFSHSVAMNLSAHELLNEAAPLEALSIEQTLAEMEKGTVVIDTRTPNDFTLGHIIGSINIGLDGRFAETAGQILSPETKIILTGEPEHIQEAHVRLARIGYDNCIGQLPDVYTTLEDHPDLSEVSERIDAAHLPQTHEAQIIDVRSPSEVESGMVYNAHHIPLPRLHEKYSQLDPTQPTVVYCAGGWRSSVAASFLKAHGFENVRDVIGGYNAIALQSA